MPRHYVRTRKIAGGGFRHYTEGGALINSSKIKDWMNGAANYVKSKAGPQVDGIVENGKDLFVNVIQAGKDDIFNEINKRLNGLSFVPKKGGAIHRMR
jgi:hypothetical protein